MNALPPIASLGKAPNFLNSTRTLYEMRHFYKTFDAVAEHYSKAETLSHFCPSPVVPFPAGDTSSDTFISGHHWNVTTLQHFGYTLYQNGTLSNRTSCHLFFDPWINNTRFDDDGQFYEATACTHAVRTSHNINKISMKELSMNKISTGTAAFVAFVLFMLCILLAVLSLAKYVERRNFADGASRRGYQWYWMIAAASLGIISSSITMSSDANFMISASFAWAAASYLLVFPATMALVWESMAHCRDWSESQSSGNSLQMGENKDRKVKQVVRRIVYALCILQAMLVIIRPWSNILKQRSCEETLLLAKPAASNFQSKAAAHIMVTTWAVILFYFITTPVRCWSRQFSIIKVVRFTLLAACTSYMVYLQTTLSGIFIYSPLAYGDFTTGPKYLYGLGPIMVVLLVNGVFGFFEPIEYEEVQPYPEEKREIIF